MSKAREALAEALTLIAAWHTPGGPTPQDKKPSIKETCLDAAEALLATPKPEAREALVACVRELELVLDAINADRVPFDGDDFHEALKLGQDVLATPGPEAAPAETDDMTREDVEAQLETVIADLRAEIVALRAGLAASQSQPQPQQAPAQGFSPPPYLRLLAISESLIGFVQEAISSPAAKRFDEHYVPRLRQAVKAFATHPTPEAAQDSGRWISVEERLPSADLRVIFWHVVDGRGYACVGEKAVDDDESPMWLDQLHTDRDGDPTDCYGVTHWQPLPAQPEAAPAAQAAQAELLRSAKSALRRIESMTGANHVCACGRPTGLAGVQTCANRALSERPLLDADDSTSAFDAAPSPKPSQAGPVQGEGLPREDFDKVSSDLTRAKRLIVDVWQRHPETRSLVEARTGNWFVWGTDRFSEGQQPGGAPE